MKQQLRSNFKQAKGFTLIELIIVIIILGILAVTAAPKFIDIQGEARESVMKGVEGSIRSAATMAHAKALVAGVTSGNISVGNSTIAILNSYPTNATMISMLTLDDSISHTTGTFQHPSATTPAECQVTYVQPVNAGDEPTITGTYTDC